MGRARGTYGETKKKETTCKKFAYIVRTILKWTLIKYDWKVWTGFIWHRIRTNRGLL